MLGNRPFRQWILAVLVVLTTTTGQAQQYFFGHPVIRNYKPEEFKGGIQSWGMVQDDRELLYIANNFGLLEFDGATWSLYSPKSGTKVRSVYVGEDGKVYVGSQADFGYFQPDKQGVLQYFSLADSLPQKYRNFDEVWRIYEQGGRIYFFTFKNIYSYAPGKKVQVLVPDTPLDFSFQVNREIYSLMWGKGLALLENNALHLLPGGNFFADKQIASILPFDKNQLLIFTIKDGVYLYDGHAVAPFQLSQEVVGNGLIINQALLLKDGNFALATQNKGLVLMDNRGRLLLNTTLREGLLDNTIHTLYQDTQDNLWLAMNNGISMVELSSPFSRLDGTMGLSGTGYAALQKGNNLYLGTNSGLFVSDVSSPKKSFAPVPNGTGQVYHLSQIWNQVMMGHHNGPFLVKEGQATQLYPGAGAWEFVPLPNQPGKVVMGTYKGISLLSADEKGLTFLKNLPGLEESSRVLEFDKDGELWMAHGYKGLFRITLDQKKEEITSVKFYNSKHGLPADHLVNMEKIGNELIFPAMYGVYRFDKAKDRFVLDKKYSSLFAPDEHVIEMEEDVQGNIYFISNQRVGKITFDKFGKPTLEDRLFNNLREQLNDDLSFIQVLDINNVLFGAKEGFIHYNAAKNKRMAPFHTRLAKFYTISNESDSLLLSGRLLDKSSGLELPFALNSLRFVYAASFYEKPEKTQFQYLLKNFDTAWSEWTTKTEKEYTNLPEGTYVFQVRARNIYGTISEAKSFTFVVKPPFYRSTLAYVVYTILGMLLLGAAFYQVDNRFKNEKRRILLDKERKLGQKEIEIRHITNQSEQEIDRLRNEKFQAELDHKNRELTYSTIHLINKNELLSSVKLELQSILNNGGRTPSQEELKKIIRNIDQNITSEIDWKQFELHFNHVHGDFIHRLQDQFPNLTPQEIKLSTYLRLNLTTKDIAQLLNISVRGVEISRYRLRKRLCLDRSDNLTDFMLKF
ncbi:triple tyrosine motif-containing protein [Rufibacter sediminis]|uniref:Two component regulator three y domain-containing protein n=1 Tax=Rufibacter sediminis TaxID=2762756 RepID=A0ABR6VSV7_9BACT|nr:triple tyrosine motif-containing protein [Rufibacter sediminis]MBC3540015.1 two component regulator three y domain-containing protein [Rufibacter sediminis]